ncbi:MAG: helix-turn-helix domain-containing protein [Actinomycetota bacterium]|nr:helix-turn-helix domain-containing protein [Actinomycetota bacterium]
MRVVGHEQRHAEQAPTTPVEDAALFGGVQSVARTLDVFEGVAAAGEQSSINEIASSGGLPVPTTLRLVRTVVDRRYVRQLPNRRHALGSRLVPLGSEAAGAMLGAWGLPLLAALVAELGESSDIAVLDRDRVMHVEQVQSHHAKRISTEVGRRVFKHSTGVGKAVLPLLTEEHVRALVHRTGRPADVAHHHRP